MNIDLGECLGAPDWNGRREEFTMSNSHTAIIIRSLTFWSPNQVNIHTYENEFYSMIRKYRVEMPIYFSMPELYFCDCIELEDPTSAGFSCNVSTIDSYYSTRVHKVKVRSELLKNVNQVTFSTWY